MAAESSEGPPSPPPSPPMSIEGSDRDAVLSKSEWLSRREVLERRSRRTKQLARVYRQHYWGIMEDLKSKHRDYYWTYGKSPFKDDEDRDNNNNSYAKQEQLGDENGIDEGHETWKCTFSSCKSKAMALTKFCHTHILTDLTQHLYTNCTCVVKSMQSGPLICCKPVLKTAVPLLCVPHYQKAEKCLMRDLRKAGLNISSLSNLAPKFHVLISEYINQIQSRRRAFRKTSVCKIEPK